jgi:hypothetical protein
MTLTTSQVTALTDSVAKLIADFNTNFNTGTSTATTTMNAGVSGTGATSATLGRVLAYAGVPDVTDELVLLAPTYTVATNVAAYLSGIRSVNAFAQQLFPLLDKLDSAVSGLNAFLTTNTLQVNAWFAAAFNLYVTNAALLGYRTSANMPVAIATANYFPYAAIDTMWTFACSGSATFSSNAVGSNANTSAFGGGVGQIYIYKSNATNAVGGATFTITYTNAAGNAATATYTTNSGTPVASGSLSAGYAVTGAIGSAITGVTGSGMTSGEDYTLGIQLVRAAAY